MSKSTKPQPKVLGQEDVKRWLMDFQQALNNFKLLSGKEELARLFHPKAIGFESGVSGASSADEIIRRQWKSISPDISYDFGFLFENAKTIPAPGMFVVTINHISLSKNQEPPCFGQWTFVLCDFEGRLLGVHSHVSPCPG